MQYKIPFVDIKKHYQNIKPEIDAAIADVFARGDYILREDLIKFEKTIARFVGVKYAVGVNSGFDALHLSLKAAGIGAGDEVITVAHTFVATVAAIVHNCATATLVDIGKDGTMDTGKVEAVITKRTKAIIPVHLNGRLTDMSHLAAIAKKHKLLIIEDAAQALGAKFKNKMAGSFGAAGCFSLYPFKMLGCFGDGGIVTTNNKTIAQKLIWLRDHGQDRPTGRIMSYGFNSRLDNLQAAILNAKFKHFTKWVARRRAVAALYRKHLSNIEQIQLPHYNDPRFFDVYQNYCVRSQKRDELKQYLAKNGIETLISWPKPMHNHSALKLQKFKLPETEKLCREIISLPMNTEITDEQVVFVAKTIQKFYQNP